MIGLDSDTYDALSGSMLSYSPLLPAKARRGVARAETSAEVEYNAKSRSYGPRGGKSEHGA